MAYCYEVQLEERAQRKGLGKHLMQLLELIVSHVGVAGGAADGVGTAGIPLRCGGGRPAFGRGRPALVPAPIHHSRHQPAAAQPFRPSPNHSTPQPTNPPPKAVKYGMAGVMLTVMRGNGAALSFYHRLGYKEHASSPGYDDPDASEGYLILFKPLVKARPHAHGHAHAHGHGCGCSH